MNYFNHIEFANPNFLYLLVVLPLLIVWYFTKNKNTFSHIHFSNSDFNKRMKRTFKQKMQPSLYILRLLCLAFIIVALARPQSNFKNSEENLEGIDIVIAMDISSSMLAEDFSPNRLEASKAVAKEFIENRPNDRIGIVAFSGEAFTKSPLTIDQGVLFKQLSELKSGIITDGTAIGDGLAIAINRLKDSEAISKTIILLTDGINNMGALAPLSAADMAHLYGIRLYTIGVGSQGAAPYPFQTPFGVQYQNVEVEIDEALLQKMAETTGGKYFRATNKRKLENIFKEIDTLEKTKVEVLSFEHKSEEFKIWVLLALICLFLEITLRYSIFKTLP